MIDTDSTTSSPPTPRPWLRRLGLALVALVALGAAGMWALSHYVDRARIVALVAAEVKQATGRDIHVDGAIGFHLRPGLVVQIEGVRLSNSAWGSQPDMLKVRRVELDVALRPLLDKRLVIRQVLLDGVEVWLETDAQGQGNWLMQAATPPAAAPAAAEAAGQPLVIDLAKLEITNSSLSFHDGRGGRDETLSLKALSLLDSGADDQVDIQMQVRGQAISIKGRTGKLTAIARGGDRFPLDLVLALEGGRFSAKGDVGVGARAGTANLEITAAVQQTAALSALAGTALPPTLPLPLQFSGRIEQAGGVTALPAFKLAVAGQALSGQLRYQAADKPGAQRPRLSGAINAEMLDLAALGAKAAAPAKTSTGAASPGRAGKLFNDAALPLPTLPALDAQLELNIAQLRWPGAPAGAALSALHTVIRLQDGAVEARPLAFKLAGGAVSGMATLRLPGGASAPGMQLQLQADAVQLDQALALALAGKSQGVKGGRSDLRLALSASGASAHQWASSLNGEFRLSMGPAHLSGNLAALGGDIATRLVEAVNPAHKRNQGSDLQCVALRLPIQRGHIAIDHGVAMESEQLDVVASGEIDLGAETLALAFRPTVKQGLGVGVGDLAQLVQLRGSLSQPSIAVDLKGATREAASIGAAVATGGLSLIGQRMLKEKRDPHPCAAALAGGKASGDAERPPGPADPQAKTPAKPDAGKPGLLRGLGRR